MDALKLPLWKNVLEALLEGGVSYGDTFDTEYFEDGFRAKRDTMEFGLSMSKVRFALLEYGLFISGRGGHGDRYVVIDPASNVKVMEQYQREAIRALRKGVILGTNTDMSLLGEDEKRRHEAVLERMAIRSALMSRKVGTLKKLGIGA